ncbi:glycosyl hydrolase family 8 [Kaistia dalseonensis]
MVMTREPRAAELTIRGTISQAAWQVYCERFLDPSGRIIDDANGNISHTEGQGYGLLLALAADDRAGFERIWTFTQTEMLLRNDGLAVWKWLPTTPHVPDINNASDGDLLIAYALSLAGKAWSDDRYTQAATALAEALGKATVIDERGESLLLPGASGFATKDRADGPVINLSYWIFEALPVMQQLAPDTDWQALARSGLDLLASARFGDAGLPSEWISLHGGKAKPAAGFDPVFGYNALRIPFYLVRAGIDNPDLLAPFSAAWAGAGVNGLPIINVMTNQIDERLTDAGYRMLPALLACVRSGTKIPSELKSFTPTHYYPSTLYLLSISYLAERHAECL